MAIDLSAATNAATSSNPKLSNFTSSKSAAAQAQDFLKLLATQLAHQDPLEPMDNGEFVAQLAQFSSLEQAQNTNTAMQELLGLQRLSQSATLVGRDVEYLGSDGAPQSGRVDAVRISDDKVVMSVNGDDVLQGSLIRVLAPTV